jgi:Transcription factor WhiB
VSYQYTHSIPLLTIEVDLIGLCSTNRDPDLWFPEEQVSQGRPSRANHERMVKRALTAISICQSCPTRPECLTEGMKEENIEHGIWGGMLAGDRITLARSRRSGSVREQAIVFAEGVKAWQSIS